MISISNVSNTKILNFYMSNFKIIVVVIEMRFNVFQNFYKKQK